MTTPQKRELLRLWLAFIRAFNAYLQERGLATMDYDPNQKRNKDGKFAKGGAGMRDENTEAKIKAASAIDFTKNNVLPGLNGDTLSAYGLADKPVLLKKNIIDKNKAAHPDVTDSDARVIIGRSLYKPEAVLKANPDKPAYHNFISRIEDDKNTVVLLELADNKDNYEIVNYHWIKDEARRRKERKADREDAHPI